MNNASCRSSRGFSLVGILISMVIMVVLFSILMTSLNKAVTGQGSAVQGTVRSMEDNLYLTAMFQSVVVDSMNNKGERFVTPSDYAGSSDQSLNTTANLFSAMIQKNFTTCKQLIAGNEYSGYVQEKTDYDFTAYNPSRKVYWDTTFVADLGDLSNTSYAHEPLYGDRFDDHWRNTLSSTFPIFGNRGPKDGVANSQSFTYGRNAQWGGHVVYGDGHTAYINTFTPNGLVFEMGGETYQDNIFKMDAKPNGGDAVLAFTKAMTKQGPTLQWD